MTDIRQVRHTDFRTQLSELVADNPKGLVLGLRADGEAEDANIVVKIKGKAEFWRITVNGFKDRAASWTIFGIIQEALMGACNEFPDDVRDPFEKPLNSRRGYVWLTIKNGSVQKSEFTASL